MLLSKTIPIFYSTLLLTGVNLLLRLVGTSFQVFISNTLGPEGIGLLQLTMSVGSLAMVGGIAGVRTASMYLTAGELGQRRRQNITWILSACFLYSIFCSGAVSLLLYLFAPDIAQNWIGDIRTVGALRLLAAFLPVTCLCGVMTGYFTAANRIGTLAAVEVGEQFCSMAITMVLLKLWAGNDPGRACQSIVLGSSFGACLTLSLLIFLRLQERAPIGPRIRVAKPLLHTALPLALADLLKSGITTTENLMVPKRLALHTATANPIGAFGIVSGMVFPVLMFPACILFGLTELLIPELARCAAAGSHQRIAYLVRRSLKAAMLYSLFLSGIMFLLAPLLCQKLYQNPDIGFFLRLYSILIPMLYCDIITDAMIKGLGQQTASVRYNIFTSAVDVAFLYFLLPRYGMTGYFISFLFTHLVNFLLSLRRLLRISGESIPAYIPLLSAAAGIASVWGASGFSLPLLRCVSYFALLGSLLCLLGIIRREDLRWIYTLLKGK